MTGHVPDHLINDHPRVDLSGLHPYSVICGDVHANYGWGDGHYQFVHPACSAMWKGLTATYRLHADGQLELISFEFPPVGKRRGRMERVNERLSGDFWLVLKPHFEGQRSYIPFRAGRIVEDETAWVIHEPRLGRITGGTEYVVDAAARFLYKELPGQLIEEGREVPALLEKGIYLVCLSHRSAGRPTDALQDSVVMVEERTRRASWASMTPAEWAGSSDPCRMLLSVYRIVDPQTCWRLVCLLGRRFWLVRRPEELDFFAIETTERWLVGQATEDDLNGAWFDATGTGAGLESGWQFALDLASDCAGTSVASPVVADLVREVLGHPLEGG